MENCLRPILIANTLIAEEFNSREIARRPPVEACRAVSVSNPLSSSWRVILVTLAGASLLTFATSTREIGAFFSMTL